MEQNITKPTPADTYKAIGIMSGTSLDGLDICLAHFNLSNSKWSYKIIKAETVNYDEYLRNSLIDSVKLSGRELMHFDTFYGKWIGERVKEFLSGVETNVDVIGSHGHTIFHEPAKGISTQIGNGAHIAAVTGIPCISNYRSGDVARGGQGAPLVPIGDELLFDNYEFCLNLGGIANISYKSDGKRLAYDICPSNMIFNYLANQTGEAFDKNGQLGRMGKVDENLLLQLNDLPYYQQIGAKSLGREWFECSILPPVDQSKIDIRDKARTIYEHISFQIANAINAKPVGKVQVTGGGSKNGFLVELIREKCKSEIIIPEAELVDYKEALIFGFLAVLFQLGIPASLSSVTGAYNDSIAGCLYK